MKQENFYEQLSNQFSDDLPEGHEERFEKKLKTIHYKLIRHRLFVYSSMAASIIMALFISILVYRSDLFHQKITDQEFRETQLYYTAEIKFKMKQLSRHPNIAKTVMSDIKDIDRSVKNIQKELNRNPDDERVINAAIITYQTKLDLLNTVIHQTKMTNKL